MKSVSLTIIAILVITLVLMLVSCTNGPDGSINAGVSGTTKQGQTYYANVTVPLAKRVPATGK